MTDTLQALADLRARVVRAVEARILGQRTSVDLLLVAHFARGHALLEGVPGVGKTSLCAAVARTLGADFGRIQLTADLMPSDILGTHVYDPHNQRFVFERGPIFRGFVLADELNRAPPRTQSALLEAMQERAVTLDGKPFPLPDHFTLFATQNPIEQEGTYPLPEAELDRFLLKLTIGYPGADDEDRMLAGASLEVSAPFEQLASVVSDEELSALRSAAGAVHVADNVRRYVRDVVRATRAHPEIRLGASPRAAVHLLVAARWAAAFAGSSYLTPDHVAALVEPVLAHRLKLTPEAELDGHSPERALASALRTVEVPR